MTVKEHGDIGAHRAQRGGKQRSLSLCSISEHMNGRNNENQKPPTAHKNLAMAKNSTSPMAKEKRLKGSAAVVLTPMSNNENDMNQNN